jgi:hypothetical protein
MRPQGREAGRLQGCRRVGVFDLDVDRAATKERRYLSTGSETRIIRRIYKRLRRIRALEVADSKKENP